MRSSLLSIAFAFGTALLLSGCSPAKNLSPVTGKVLVNGKPAGGAIVMLLVDGPTDLAMQPATAVAADDGTFRLMTGGDNGVKPGKYVVTVVYPDPAKKPTDAQKMMGVTASDAPDLLKGRYATRQKTTLRIEVLPGATTLEPFDLK